MLNYEKLYIKTIKNGTIIDHIPYKVGINLIFICNINISSIRSIICLNLFSKKNKIKDILKLDNYFLNKEQINKIKVYATNSTINTIYNYKIVKKKIATLPKYVVDIIDCPNKNCITRNEPISSKFLITNYISKKIWNCQYCEKQFDHKFIVSKKLK